MLDCFDGLISLDRACAAGSGVVSLQSQGIDETLIGKFTGAEDTAQSLLSDCEEHARLVLSHDVLTYFSDRIIPRTFVDRKKVGEPNDRQELQGDTGDGGILIEIDQPRSNVVLTIGSLGLYAATTGDVTITVYDLSDGSTVLTHVFAATAGQYVTEQVQLSLPAYRERKQYFIAHDLTQWYRTDMGADCASCSMTYEHGGVRITGARLATGLPKKRSNLRLSSGTSGLSALVTVSCDHARMLCEVKSAMALPYVLKVAETIIRRGVENMDRLNSFTMDRDKLTERADRIGAEYAAAMTNSVGRMRMPEDPMCFTCRNNTRSFTSAP